MNNRAFDVQKFTEHCFREKKYIEPELRASRNKEQLLDVIGTYSPELIVKIGLGCGALLLDLAKESKGTIAVVEPSLANIREYVRDFGEKKSVRFITGDLNVLPVDYYMADMVISIDNISFIESGPAIDEFRRIMQFDAILYISTPILSERDEEGLLDDYIRMIFPLHNEYYMADELKTVLEHNEFGFIKGDFYTYRESLSELSDFFCSLYGDKRDDCQKFLGETKDIFETCYDYKDGEYSLSCYSGVFRRLKPDYAYAKGR